MENSREQAQRNGRVRLRPCQTNGSSYQCHQSKVWYELKTLRKIRISWRHEIKDKRSRREKCLKWGRS